MQTDSFFLMYIDNKKEESIGRDQDGPSPRCQDTRVWVEDQWFDPCLTEDAISYRVVVNREEDGKS